MVPIHGPTTSQEPIGPCRAEFSSRHGPGGRSRTASWLDFGNGRGIMRIIGLNLFLQSVSASSAMTLFLIHRIITPRLCFSGEFGERSFHIDMSLNSLAFRKKNSLRLAERMSCVSGGNFS